MFVNSNKFELGYRQTGEALGDVVLPSWADSAEEFVRINRAALESDFVSANLHHWIDLIFGCKQRGEAAVAAKNVFFHLTYGGAVNWDAIQDARERVAIEDQIRHFGQMPAQLLRVPHVARRPRTLRPGGLLGAGCSIGSADPWVTGRAAKFSMHVLSLYQEQPIVFVGMMVHNCSTSPELLAAGPVAAIPSALKRFVTVTAARVPAIHHWADGEKNVPTCVCVFFFQKPFRSHWRLVFWRSRGAAGALKRRECQHREAAEHRGGSQPGNAQSAGRAAGQRRAGDVARVRRVAMGLCERRASRRHGHCVRL